MKVFYIDGKALLLFFLILILSFTVVGQTLIETKQETVYTPIGMPFCIQRTFTEPIKLIPLYTNENISLISARNIKDVESKTAIEFSKDTTTLKEAVINKDLIAKESINLAGSTWELCFKAYRPGKISYYADNGKNSFVENSTWVNITYFWRQDYNCSSITNKSLPVVLNGSYVNINGSNQVIWTYCNDVNVSVYYNNYNDYAVYNSTTAVPYVVAKGNKTHADNIWNGLTWGVWLLTNTVDDFSENNYDLTIQGSGANYVNGFLNGGINLSTAGFLNFPAGFTQLQGTTYTVDTFFKVYSYPDGLSGILSDTENAEGTAVIRLYAASDGTVNYGQGSCGLKTSAQTITTDSANHLFVGINGNNAIWSINNTYNYSDTFGCRNTNTVIAQSNRFTFDTGFIGNTELDHLIVWKDDLGGSDRAQIYNNYHIVSGYANYITTGEQPPIAPQALTVTLDSPPNNTLGPATNTFNFTVVGTNTTYQNCSIYFNGTLKNTAVANNNTQATFNLTGIGGGEWLWNVTCWIDSTTYNTSEAWNYSVETTTTTTTTASSSTTIATGTNYTNIGTLWIYSFIFPALAVIFTIAAWHFNKNFLPSMLAGFMWYVSTFTTRSIIFVDNFTVSSRTYYVAAGNPEYNWIYIGLGVIMIVYGVFVLLIGLKSQGTNFGGQQER